MGRPISLTAIGRATMLVAALGLSAGAAWLFGVDPARLRLAQAAQGEAANAIARRLIVYRLQDRKTTEFRFTQPVTIARVVMHPVLFPGTASAGLGWTYSIRAELLDESGTVLATREISSRALLFDAAGRMIGPRRFYQRSNDQVALGDEVRIALERPFAALRLAVVRADQGVRYIDARVSERRPLIASAAESAFHRYSAADQARLAAANAFPPALLTPEEATSIAINQWRPVGPVGIEGRDHVMAVLYEEERQGGGTWEFETEEETGG